MSPGSHAAGDGSFGRSAGIQVGRAAIILVIAVLIGVVLLKRNPGGGGGAVSTSGATVTTRSRPVVTPKVTTGGTGTSTAPLRSPQDIKVLVANGTTTSGLAGKVSNTLRAKGYNTLASTNSTLRPTATIIYFVTGYGPEAAALAQALGLPPSAPQPMPTPPPVASLGGANIVVIAGPDLANDTGTTTTAKAGTTSTSKP